jgi:hypothetical protein
MAEAKKCANAACSCVPPKNSKYCSQQCEGIGNKTEIVCLCGHSGCGGNVNEPSQVGD